MKIKFFVAETIEEFEDDPILYDSFEEAKQANEDEYDQPDNNHIYKVTVEECQN